MYYDEGGRNRRIYAWIVVLLIVIAVINTPFFRRTRILHAARTLSSNVIYPFKYAVTGIWNGTTYAAGNFLRIKGVQRENDKLKTEISELQSRITVLNGLERENTLLRQALSFKSRFFVGRLMAAEIVGRSSSSWFEVIEINRGSADNVVQDTAVVNAEGLVGRVFEVTHFTSKVLLLNDPTSAVSVIDDRSGDMAIASGNSIGPLSIKYMPANADIRAGDRIVTSGLSEIFPRGLMVGTVRSISKKDYDIFQKVDVDPSVNFSRLDKLFVVVR